MKEMSTLVAFLNSVIEPFWWADVLWLVSYLGLNTFLFNIWHILQQLHGFISASFSHLLKILLKVNLISCEVLNNRKFPLNQLTVLSGLVYLFWIYGSCFNLCIMKAMGIPGWRWYCRKEQDGQIAWGF